MKPGSAKPPVEPVPPKAPGEPVAPKAPSKPVGKGPVVKEFDPNAPEHPRLVTLKGDIPLGEELSVKNAEFVKPIEGVWDVVVHGCENGKFYKVVIQRDAVGNILRNAEGKVLTKHVPVSTAEIKQALGDGGWQPGQPVRVLGCKVGSSGAVDSLAEELSAGGPKTWVRAPNATIKIDEAGNILHVEKVTGPNGESITRPVRPSWTSVNCPPDVIQGRTIPGFTGEASDATTGAVR
jgi:hypothetical protein